MFGKSKSEYWKQPVGADPFREAKGFGPQKIGKHSESAFLSGAITSVCLPQGGEGRFFRPPFDMRAEKLDEVSEYWIVYQR